MRLSDLVNIDEAWYDPRTWGKQARQDAAGSKIGAGYAAAGKLDAQNAAGSKIGAGYAAAAAPKPTRTGRAAKPTAAPAPAAAAPAVDADLEQRKEVARLFGPDTTAPAAPAASAKSTAALAPSQVTAATPPANNMKNAADVMRSGQASNQANQTNKTAPAATAEPDPNRFGKPNVNIDPTNTGAAAKPAAEPQATAPTPAAEPAPATAPAGQAAMSYAGNQGGAAETPTTPTVKTQTPAGPIMAEETPMKKLLNIFTEAEASSGIFGAKSLRDPSELKAKRLPSDYYEPVRRGPDWKGDENFKFPKDPYSKNRAYEKDAEAGYGRYGKNTSDLQNYINKLGYKDEKGNPLQLDARYGPKTGAAVDALKAKLDPNSPEYKTLRSFDAAASYDKDSRISGPIKKTKPVDKPEPAAEPTAVDTTSKPSDMKNAGDVYRAAQQDKNSNTVSAATPTNIVSYDNKFYDRDGTGDLDQPGVDTDTDTGAAAKPAAPTDKTPDNVGPIVRTGTGGTLTTSDGTPVRSRSADEIANTGAFGIQKPTAADREQGEKNWKSVKNFLGFGDKPAAPATPTPTSGGSAKPSNQTPEVMIENDLSEIMRLSGLQLNEKAVSKQQQKFMGMVHAIQKGEKVKGASSELKKAAKGMSKKDSKDFAATKHKGLPQKVTEGVMLEAGNALEHIIDKFRHETKSFVNGSELDSDLYDALYDYYLSNGDMPYGVAKARDGDPFEWIANKFESELDMMGYQRMNNKPDNSLSELARLAGLHESKIDECGDMPVSQPDSFNVSTNMSSDGTKSVNISAQGDKADALLQMLKMAGMRPHDDHEHMSHEEPEIVLVSSDDEMMEEPELEEERITQYANTPEEEYETVAAITRQGNDLNREKQQWNPDRGRDNPMAFELEESLAAMLESIKVTEGGVGGIDAEQPYKDPKTGKMVTPPKGATMPPPDSEFPPGDKRNMMPPKQKGAK